MGAAFRLSQCSSWEGKGRWDMRESSFVDNHWQLISFCDSNQASPLDQAEFEGISCSCLQQITFWLIFWQLSSRIKRKIPECIIMANQESNFLSLSSWDPRGRNFSNWFVSVSFVPSLYCVCLFFMYIHPFATILSLWERIKFKRIENFYNIKSYWLGYIAICCQVNFCSDRKSHAHHSFAFTVTWLDSVGGASKPHALHGPKQTRAPKFARRILVCSLGLLAPMNTICTLSYGDLQILRR